jgi:hypothetical protein
MLYTNEKDKYYSYACYETSNFLISGTENEFFVFPFPLERKLKLSGRPGFSFTVPLSSANKSG